MGRKPKDIDEESVRKLASYGCTQEEIADYFGCDHAVISRRFSQAFKLGKANVRKNVRMWQIRRAKAGSDTMLIHLGKHYCGQTEKNASAEPLEDAPATDEHGNETEP